MGYWTTLAGIACPPVRLAPRYPARMPDDYSGQDLSGANLARADLSRANLRGADLTGAIMDDVLPPRRST